MNKSNASKQARQEQRRHEVGKLYAKGLTQHAIGERLGISQTTVSRDIQTILERWRETTTSAIDRLKAQELLNLRAVETAAWESFDLSRQPDPEPEPVEGEKPKPPKRPRTGETRWLAIIQKTIELRAKILGLNTPDKIVMAGGFNENAMPWLSERPEELDERIADIKARRLMGDDLDRTDGDDLDRTAREIVRMEENGEAVRRDPEAQARREANGNGHAHDEN